MHLNPGHFNSLSSSSSSTRLAPHLPVLGQAGLFASLRVECLLPLYRHRENLRLRCLLRQFHLNSSKILPLRDSKIEPFSLVSSKPWCCELFATSSYLAISKQGNLSPLLAISGLSCKSSYLLLASIFNLEFKNNNQNGRALMASPPSPPSCSASFIRICFSSKWISSARGIRNIITTTFNAPYL